MARLGLHVDFFFFHFAKTIEFSAFSWYEALLGKKNINLVSHSSCSLPRSRKTHPGAVVHLSDNPIDPNKVS